MLAVRQAAEVLSVTARTIYRWVTEGRVHARRTPSGHLRLCENSLLGPLPDEERSFSPRDGRIKQAVRLIQERYQDANLTLDKLSTHVRLSSGYLSRLFKKETGVSFRDYLREARMRKAAELLRGTLLSIKEIALEVGYRHVSDFDHHFKMTYGMTPRRYRESSHAVQSKALAESSNSQYQWLKRR